MHHSLASALMLINTVYKNSTQVEAYMRPSAFPLQSTPGILTMETTFLMQLWHPALISQCIK
jgi:hypothetical protein